MAIHKIMVALLFLLALANVGHSTSQQVLKGSLSCLDCDKDYDFSGIKIAFKCKQAKKLTLTCTSKDGSFKTALPTDVSASTASANCVASVLGGPEQLYTKRKNMVTNIIKVHASYYTISNPLSFYKSCPQSHGKCGATNSGGGVESSKTFDLPPLGEWGFPPSSPYIPFFPIIGIP